MVLSQTLLRVGRRELGSCCRARGGWRAADVAAWRLGLSPPSCMSSCGWTFLLICSFGASHVSIICGGEEKLPVVPGSAGPCTSQACATWALPASTCCLVTCLVPVLCALTIATSVCSFSFLSPALPSFLFLLFYLRGSLRRSSEKLLCSKALLCLCS